MTTIERLITTFDQGLRTVWAPARASRPNPAEGVPEPVLTEDEKRQSAARMRVNHVGEICAQALYHAQALTARDAAVRAQFEAAAREEMDHLAWCEARLADLGARKSLLNPLWYGGAFAMGAAAGLLGDRWNLGFMAETERQVEAHLDGHLDTLPAADLKSRAVVEAMKADEAAHGEAARAAGGEALPAPVKLAMRLAADVMRATASRV